MKKIYISLFIITSVAIALVFDSTSTYSNPSGAPAGCSSSPSDQATCATSGCHSGTASAKDGMVTSDVPSTGYIPGSVYTITVSITKSGTSKWGFECSPQDASGTRIGTLAITNSTETKLVGSSTYVTHKTAGNSGSGSKSWSFHWTAPSSGTGDVPFYASVMAANNNGGTSGDLVYYDTYYVAEDVSTAGIHENSNENFFSIYPNPIEGNEANVEFSAAFEEYSKIQILSLRGIIVKEINHLAKSNGKQQLTIPFDDISTGVYFLQIQTSTGVKSSRIIRR